MRSPALLRRRLTLPARLHARPQLGYQLISAAKAQGLPSSMGVMQHLAAATKAQAAQRKHAARYALHVPACELVLCSLPLLWQPV